MNSKEIQTDTIPAAAAETRAGVSTHCPSFTAQREIRIEFTVTDICFMDTQEDHLYINVIIMRVILNVPICASQIFH